MYQQEEWSNMHYTGMLLLPSSVQVSAMHDHGCPCNVNSMLITSRQLNSQTV